MIFGLPQIDFIARLLHRRRALAGPLHRGVRLRGDPVRASTRCPPGRPRRPARSGSTFGQSLREVVLPQAFRTVIPPLGNVFIAHGEEHLDRGRLRHQRAQLAAPAAGQRRRRRADRRPPRSGRRLHAHHAARWPSACTASSAGWRSSDDHARCLFDIPGPKARARIRIGTVIGVAADPRRCIAVVLIRLGSNGQLDPPALGRAVRPAHRRPADPAGAPWSTPCRSPPSAWCWPRSSACCSPSAGCPTTASSAGSVGLVHRVLPRHPAARRDLRAVLPAARSTASEPIGLPGARRRARPLQLGRAGRDLPGRHPVGRQGAERGGVRRSACASRR